jgi:hypothetical protein
MTEEEIEAVAEELAKAGGLSWYPGRTRGPLLRTVSERYRDRARLAIEALDRVRARNQDLSHAGLVGSFGAAYYQEPSAADWSSGSPALHQGPHDDRVVRRDHYPSVPDFVSGHMHSAVDRYPANIRTGHRHQIGAAVLDLSDLAGDCP